MTLPIVERLRSGADGLERVRSVSAAKISREAADTIEELEARVEHLEEALRQVASRATAALTKIGAGK